MFTSLNNWQQNAENSNIDIKEFFECGGDLHVSDFKCTTNEKAYTVTKTIYEIMQFEFQLIEITFNIISQKESVISIEQITKNILTKEDGIREHDQKISSLKKELKIICKKNEKIITSLDKYLSKSTNRKKLICKIVPLACTAPLVFAKNKQNNRIVQLIEDKIKKKSGYYHDQNKKYLLFLEKIKSSSKNINSNYEKIEELTYFYPPYPIYRDGLGWSGSQPLSAIHFLQIAPNFNIAYQASPKHFVVMPEENFKGATVLLRSLCHLVANQKVEIDWLLDEEGYESTFNAFKERMNMAKYSKVHAAIQDISLMRKVEDKMLDLMQDYWKQILHIESLQTKLKQLCLEHGISLSETSPPKEIVEQIKNSNDHVLMLRNRFQFDTRGWLIGTHLSGALQEFNLGDKNLDETTKTIASIYLALLNLQSTIETAYEKSRKVVWEFSRLSSELESIEQLNKDKYFSLFMRAACLMPVLLCYPQKLLEIPLLTIETAFNQETPQRQKISLEAMEILAEPHSYWTRIEDFRSEIVKIENQKNEHEKTSSDDMINLLREGASSMEDGLFLCQQISPFLSSEYKKGINELSKEVKLFRNSANRNKTFEEIEKERIEKIEQNKRLEMESEQTMKYLEQNFPKNKEDNLPKIHTKKTKKTKPLKKNKSNIYSSNPYPVLEKEPSIPSPIEQPQAITEHDQKKGLIAQIDLLSPILLGVYPKQWQDVPRNAKDIKSNFEKKYLQINFKKPIDEENFLLEEKARHAFSPWLSKLAQNSSYALCHDEIGGRNISLFGWMRFESGLEQYGVFEWISLLRKTGPNPLYCKPHHCYFNNLSNTIYRRPLKIRESLKTCEKNELANNFNPDSIVEKEMREDNLIMIDENGYIEIVDNVNKALIRIIPLSCIEKIN